MLSCLHQWTACYLSLTKELFELRLIESLGVGCHHRLQGPCMQHQLPCSVQSGCPVAQQQPPPLQLWRLVLSLR